MKLFVISAPSGAGKTTVINLLRSKMPALVLSVSCTTRGPRPGEKDGIDYHFISKAEFNKMTTGGELLEWATVHGERYGTPKKPIDQWIKEGKDVLFDIDVQGAGSIKRAFPAAVLIFLVPPSRDELIRRLTARGAIKKSDLELRIKNADLELKQKDFYDHRVINDDLDKAVEEIEKIINAASK